MQPEELTPELAAAVLDGAALVYFDGRLTEAAVVLAAAARERGVPVLVEAERLRPGGWLVASLCGWAGAAAGGMRPIKAGVRHAAAGRAHLLL